MLAARVRHHRTRRASESPRAATVPRAPARPRSVVRARVEARRASRQPVRSASVRVRRGRAAARVARAASATPSTCGAGGVRPRPVARPRPRRMEPRRDLGESIVMPEALDVTVVVPVRDMDGLGELAAALRGQSLGVDRFEVVIADDGSRRPLDVEPDGEWLRVDRAAPANSYAARNRGARLARGRVLAFCDADCRPAPDWLEHGLAAVDDGAGLVAGEVRPRRPRRVTAWALLDADDSFNQERVVAEGYALGGNVFVRRDVFDRLGGFDETRPSGGDFELARRAVSAGERLDRK